MKYTCMNFPLRNKDNRLCVATNFSGSISINGKILNNLHTVHCCPNFKKKKELVTCSLIESLYFIIALLHILSIFFCCPCKERKKIEKNKAVPEITEIFTTFVTVCFFPIYFIREVAT